MDGPLETLLDQVRARGEWDSRQAAARTVQGVLEILGAHLVEGDRVELALLLPYPCGLILANGTHTGRVLTPERLIRAVAARDNSHPAAARRSVTAVLGAVAKSVDEALLNRILSRLPPGHGALFGRMEPA